MGKAANQGKTQSTTRQVKNQEAENRQPKNNDNDSIPWNVQY